MRPDELYLQGLQQQIGQGSQTAFASLFRLFYQKLHGFSLQYVHVHEIAEEITNDVFVKLWSRRAEISHVQNLSTYLFVSVKNHSLNYLKQYSHIHIAVEDAAGSSGLVNRNDPGEELEWKEISFQLSQVIDSLPDQCRTVFRLIKEDGFRYKEVAEILGISPRTVETQLFRAIKKLQPLIAQHTAPHRDKPGTTALISCLFLVISLFF